MHIKWLFLMLTGSMLLLLGCEKEAEVPKVQLPANLSLQVTPVTESPGKVIISFSADKANFYKLSFGDKQNEQPLVTNGGELSYTYTASGTYTIRVQAHATQDAYITESKEVTIELPVSNNPYPGGYTTAENYAGMRMVWRDEFNGSQLDANSWVFESGTGSGGWGNNELQYYRQENTAVKDGYLIITAKKEAFGGMQYTSSRIKTQGKKEFQYGRIDIRAQLPKGQGIWPALWMLGANFSTVGWPACGEIDIMEMVGGGAGKDNTVHGTLHWSNNGQHALAGGSRSLNTGVFADEFHVFSIEWDANRIKWFVDDVPFHEIDITPDHIAEEFHQPFFFIFNVAVGGNWPGSPNAATQFPQKMVVDYVRVFQKE